MTTCANTALSEKVHWNRSTQAAQEGACTHLVPEVHSDGNPAIQERLNMVPPARTQQGGKKKRNYCYSL